MDRNQTLNISANISSVWLASGKAPATLDVASTEGPAIYGLLTLGDVGSTQKLDVSSEPLGAPVQGWPLMVTFLNNTVSPKIVRLTDDTSGQSCQAFAIGSCRTVHNATCILLLEDNRSTTPVNHFGLLRIHDSISSMIVVVCQTV